MRLPERALCAIVVAFVSPAASCLVLRMMFLPFFFWSSVCVLRRCACPSARVPKVKLNGGIVVTCIPTKVGTEICCYLAGWAIGNIECLDYC